MFKTFERNIGLVSKISKISAEQEKDLYVVYVEDNVYIENAYTDRNDANNEAIDAVNEGNEHVFVCKLVKVGKVEQKVVDL